jgi:hypothetical protein
MDEQSLGGSGYKITSGWASPLSSHPDGTHNMKLPFRDGLSREDEKILAEARELAQLRLKEWISELHVASPATKDKLPPRGSAAIEEFPGQPHASGLKVSPA